MRSASVSVTDSALNHLFFDRGTARRPARLFFLGQCAGSLLLLLVLAASAFAVAATITVLVSTRDLMSNADPDNRLSVNVQSSGDEKQRPPQQ